MDFPTFRKLFKVGEDEILSTPGNRIPQAVIERDGSTVNVAIAAAAAMADEIGRQGLTAFRALFVDTAAGEDLDILAFDRFGLLRKPAGPTLGEVTITRPAPGAPGTIPAGTRLRTSDGAVTVETINDTSFLGGDLTKDQSVRGLTAGSGQDAAAGTLTQFVDAPFDSTFTVTNAAATSGSSDQETDDAFRQRIRLFFTSSQRGTLAALRLGALSVVGVEKALAIEITDPSGAPARLAEVFVVDAAGNVNATLAATVKAALNDFRAAGINVLVPVATAKLETVELTLSFAAGVDTLTVAGAVQAAVVSLVNNLNPGETLTVAAITTAAQNVDGIVNVDVVQPVGDVVPDEGQAIRTDTAHVVID